MWYILPVRLVKEIFFQMTVVLLSVYNKKSINVIEYSSRWHFSNLESIADLFNFIRYQDCFITELCSTQASCVACKCNCRNRSKTVLNIRNDFSYTSLLLLVRRSFFWSYIFLRGFPAWFTPTHQYKFQFVLKCFTETCINQKIDRFPNAVWNRHGGGCYSKVWCVSFVHFLIHCIKVKLKQ